MSDEPQADLGLIARQQREILDEMRRLRDDIDVTAAIVRRLDGTVQGLIARIRAPEADRDEHVGSTF